ncbi:MAG: agmatinase family protein [Phycisphaerales bacterium]
MATETPFDPSGPAMTDEFFGLQPNAERDAIALVAVPYEGTVSYATGTAEGPDAARAASLQVDLHDAHFGAVWRAGIAESERIVPMRGSDQDAIGEDLRARLRSHTASLLEGGKLPGVLGGEHSISLGPIEACASGRDLGVVQIDAHMDFRDGYEGHKYSHASVMRHVLERCPTVTHMLQIGVRDWCDEEARFAAEQGRRVSAITDPELWRHIDDGGSARALFAAALEPLPGEVYISFDIDGLDPSLCPCTGTPVPGGLSFNQAACLLEVIAASGRRVVGFDLVEIGRSAGGDEWDGNVAARMLYKLAGCAARSCGLID